MTRYLVAFSMALFLCFCSVYSPRNKRMTNRPCLGLFVLSAIVLILMMGLREGVGTDYYSVYVKEYERFIAEGRGYNNRFEPGFFMLMRIVALFGGDYHVLMFITACLTIGFVYLAVYKQSEKPVWSVFLLLFGGFFFFATNGVRQALAVSILMNAIPAAIKRERLRYFLIVLLASTIHTSALIFVPLYYLVNWKVNSIKSLLLLIAIIVFSGTLVSYALQIASAVSPQIARYVSHEGLTNKYLTGGNIDLSDLILNFTSLLIFLITAHGESEDRETNFLFLLVFIGFLASVLSKDMTIFSRIAMYFSPFTIIAMPRLFSSIDQMKEAWLFKSFYALFILASCAYLYGYLNFSSVIPYTTLFE